MSDNNALAMFSPSNVPAHIASLFGEIGSNIPDRTTVPSLSYEGKTWTISLDGNKTKLMSRNSDGDEVPLQIMRMVILDCAARRGRQYYEGTYDPNKVTPPRCWSADGVTPDKAIKEPISVACDTCPMSVKGSKVLDNGNATVACSQHRMMAVIPSGKMDFTPLRLKIAITSDWDSQSPEMEAQGWFSFSKYLEFLKSRGCPHTAALVTKVRFDNNVAYPKLFFSADRWLTPEEQAVVAPRVKTPEVQNLLDGSWTPAGVDGVANNGAAEPEPEVQAGNGAAPPTAETTVTTPTTPAAASRSEPEPEDNVEIVIGLDNAPAMKQAKVAKPATTKSVTGQAATQPVPEDAPQASNIVPDEVASLLEAWGN